MADSLSIGLKANSIFFKVGLIFFKFPNLFFSSSVSFSLWFIFWIFAFSTLESIGLGLINSIVIILDTMFYLLNNIANLGLKFELVLLQGFSQNKAVMVGTGFNPGLVCVLKIESYITKVLEHFPYFAKQFMNLTFKPFTPEIVNSSKAGCCFPESQRK